VSGVQVVRLRRCDPLLVTPVAELHARFFFHEPGTTTDGACRGHAYHGRMSRLRFLILTVEASRHGSFEWVLYESFDDVSESMPYARSDRAFATYDAAWRAGCVALESDLKGPHLEILGDED
jgi:hypothetical protein